jgi:hypothetical protein
MEQQRIHRRLALELPGLLGLPAIKGAAAKRLSNILFSITFAIQVGPIDFFWAHK